MIPEPEAKPEANNATEKQRSKFRLLGTVVCTLGGSLTGAFIGRQLMADPGQTYYEFMAIGISLFVIGLVIVCKYRPLKP